MRKLQVGDKVNMCDGSYCFGVQHGKYSTYCNNFNGDRHGLVVIKTGLNVMGSSEGKTSGDFTRVNDILVADNKGGFWFTQERFVRLILSEYKG